MARNPFFTPTAPPVSDSVRAALRQIVITFLQANPAVPTFPDAVIQALHPSLALAAVFQAIKDDLGL